MSEQKSFLRKAIGPILTLGVVLFVFAWLFPQMTSYADAWETISGMSLVALFGLIAATAVIVLVYPWPFYIVVPEMSYWQAFVTRNTSFMITASVPGGGAVGLGIQYAMLSSYGVSRAVSTAAIGVVSVWNTLAVLALPALALALDAFSGNLTSQSVLTGVIALVFLGVVLGVLALLLRSEGTATKLAQLAERLGRWVMNLFKRDQELSLVDPVLEFRSSTLEMVADRWISLSLTNIAVQITQFLPLWIALAEIQSGSANQLSILDMFVAYSVARLASFIPITPNGLGTVDAAMAGLLTSLGASNSEAVAAVLVWRVVSYLPQVLVGLGTFLIWRRGAKPRAQVG